MWCSIEVSGWEWFSSLQSVVVSWILIKYIVYRFGVVLVHTVRLCA